MLDKVLKQDLTSKIKIVFFITLLSIQFFGLGLLEPLELYVRDYFIHDVSIHQTEEDIVLVLLSDRTINELGEWPISRDVYAQVLNDYFQESKVVAFDLLFPNESDDDNFSKAIKKANNVVMAYVDNFNNQELVTPAISLLENAIGIGYVNYFKDDDGYTRYYRYSVTKNGFLRPSLVSSILQEAGYEFQSFDKTSKIVRLSDKELVFDFGDNSSSIYRVLQSNLDNIALYEMSDIYNGKYESSEFDNKIILIGGSFTGASDTINTPVSPSLGVKYIYDAIITILSGKQPIHIHNSIQVVILASILLLIRYISTRIKPVNVLLVTLSISVVYILLYVFLSTQYLIQFEIVHTILITSIYFIVTILSRIIQSDENNVKLSTSLDYILELEDYLLTEYNFNDYLDMLNDEILSEKDLNILGVFDFEQFKRLKFDIKPEKITLHNMHIFIPIQEKEEKKTVIIKLLKKQKLAEVNYIIALIVSASVFYSNKNAIKKKNTMFLNIFKSLVSAIDAKDPITGNHSERVADISVKIGNLLGYSEKKIELLHFSGLIHDVGKIGISEQVLNKPCFFSEDDYKEMKRHPILGGEILKIDEIDDEIYNTILQHHERIDGKGYPYGITGDRISEFSKIVKIADVYDALSSKRQYKDAWELEKVCKTLKAGSGTEFDEHILEIFIKSLQEQLPKNDKTNNQFTEGKKELIPSYVFVILGNCKTIVSESKVTRNMDVTHATNQFKYTKPIEFCHLSFGDHIITRKWMNLKPRHVIAAVDNEFDYYSLHTNNQFEQAVFIFYKEFLNALYLETETLTIDEVESNVCQGHGESLGIVNGYMIWDSRNSFIALKEIPENNSVGLLFIHKYCL